MYVTSHLPHAAFLLHVFLDIVPDATLGEEIAPCDLLKLLIAAISLQGKLHDVHCLQGNIIRKHHKCYTDDTKLYLSIKQDTLYIVFFYFSSQQMYNDMFV